MANEQKTYPTIPITHWWTLRRKFQQKTPTSVTASYIAILLNMEENSAKSNIIPSLVLMKIIDQSGSILERAYSWRDDTSYPKVCEEIRNEIYPQELLDAVHGPNINRSDAERWFARTTKVGDAASKRMAAVYEILWQADVIKGDEATSKSPNQKKPLKTTKQPKSTNAEPAPTVPEPNNQTNSSSESLREPVAHFSRFKPSLHIDVQIHVSPDSSPEQIDQIFASMAKHLKQLTSDNE